MGDFYRTQGKVGWFNTPSLNQLTITDDPEIIHHPANASTPLSRTSPYSPACHAHRPKLYFNTLLAAQWSLEPYRSFFGMTMSSEGVLLEDLCACWSGLRSRRYMATCGHGSTKRHSRTRVLNNICRFSEGPRHVLEWDVHPSGGYSFFARTHRMR